MLSVSGRPSATGVLYALWDAAAPQRWPRALAAAVIGGLVAYMVALRLAALGASLDMMFEPDFDAPSVESISVTAAPVPDGDRALARIRRQRRGRRLRLRDGRESIGLTMRPTPFRADAEGAA